MVKSTLDARKAWVNPCFFLFVCLFFFPHFLKNFEFWILGPILVP